MDRFSDRSGLVRTCVVMAAGLALSAACLATPPAARVSLLADVVPGAGSGLSTTVARFVVSDDLAYFRAGTSYQELWRTDGRPSGTFRVDLGVTANPVAFRGIGKGGVVYTRSNGLWGTDETGVLVQIAPGVQTISGASGTLVVGNHLIFAQASGAQGSQLWSYGGPEGLVQLTQIAGTSGSQITALGAAGSNAFFVVLEGTLRSLWKTDGTAAGTMLLAPLPAQPMLFPASSGLDPLGNVPVAQSSVFQASGSVVYFGIAGTPTSQVWVSDGTLGGTRVVATLNGSLGTAGIWSEHSTSSLFFARRNPSNIVELWHFGPGAGDIALLLNFPVGTSLVSLGGSNGLSTFANGTGYNATTSPTLWVSDGTPESTFALPHLLTPVGTQTTALVSATAGDCVWFTGSTPSTGVEPWLVNLSTGVIGIASELVPGPTGATPTGMFPVHSGQSVGIVARTPAPAGSYTMGYGMWISPANGGAAQPIQTSTTVAPAAPVSLGSRIFFVGNSPATGYEPYAADLCPADYDNSGAVTVGDLFAFLHDWFAGAPAANFSGTGYAPGVADLLAFVQAWMTGCN